MHSWRIPKSTIVLDSLVVSGGSALLARLANVISGRIRQNRACLAGGFRSAEVLSDDS